MELVRRLLATQPNITALNLEFSEIDTIDPLLPLLACSNSTFLVIA
jgi:hypothetical protein